jgi:hypothetical protein
MTMTMSERLVNRVARRTEKFATNRRGFLSGAALVGAALMVDPWSYLTRPASAYATVCGADNTCAAGYTVFCCTINAGYNTCPPDSFIGGWWKADNSSFCGGSARYYIDCNAYRDGRYACHCNTTTCDQRRVACNQFRYGQCNTQIPWSNTGPVLCRLISCTPPWQQFGGTCGSSSATDNQTASHSAPCLTGQAPIGTVDRISSVGNTVHIIGWAYDPDQSSTSIRIVLYEDGRVVAAVTANLLRADVNSARHITGNHGYSITLNASNGPHTFKVYAINVGGGTGNSLIGTKMLTVNPGSVPVGHVDGLTAAGNTVRVRGWAYDRDQPATEIDLDVYQDGKFVSRIHTGVPRSDVNAAFGITGNHGFDGTFTGSSGPHKYNVYALNIAGGTHNTLIGTSTIVVNPGALPIGHVDAVTSSGNTVRIRGWAYDPDQPATEISVAVYQDGMGISWFPTGLPRPDVDATHGVSGNHGFDFQFTAATGVHTFTVYAINVGGGNLNPVLGKATIAVNQAAPLGTIDSVATLGSTIRITGWAYDPDQPSTQLSVEAHLDGKAVSRHQTGLAPSDIDAGYSISGDHGFDIQLSSVPGTHTINVYAIDVGGSRPNSFIGSRQVTI